MSKWSGKVPKGLPPEPVPTPKPPKKGPLSPAWLKRPAPKPDKPAAAPRVPPQGDRIPESEGFIATHVTGARRIDKVPGTKLNATPFDGQAEQAVLGSMLIEAPAIQTARQFLKPEHFFYRDHSLIFTTIVKLADKGTAVDVVTVMSALRDCGKWEGMGGTFGPGPYLTDCIHRVTTAAHAEHYAKIVAGLYYEREIIRTAGEVAFEQRNDVLDRLRVLHLEKEALQAPFIFNYQHGLVQVLDELASPKKQPIFKTYFPTIDACWHGMKKGEVNTWAAATNEGKSVVLANLMDRAGMDRQRCLYVGTEMTAIETVSRHLSIQSNVEAWRIRKPELTKPHLSKLHSVMADVMSKMQVSILDDPEPDLAKIEAAIYTSKAEIVFLDYLERFTMPRAENLRLQIKEFMRRLKTMARRNGVVVHLAAQLNRDTYGSEERPPTLADLSESSAIEKESDRVVLLWSPKNATKQHRGPNATPTPAPVQLKEHHRLIQAIGAKNRHGPKGLTFELVLNEINLKVQEMSEYKDPFNHPIEETSNV